ncbi:MAG: glycosyltransferase [Elusimicrobiota bacterium]
MTRILYLITDFDFGGTEKQLADLAQRLDKKAFQPIVVSLKTAGHAAAILRKSGIPVYALGMGTEILRKPLKFISALIKLEKLILDFDPDIIHTFLFRANIIGRVMGRLLRPGIKIVSTLGVWDNRYLPTLLERCTSSWADAMTTNSQWVKQQATATLRYPANKLHVILNGVDADHYINAMKDRNSARAKEGITTDEIVFLSVGRAALQKGYPYLLQAYSRIVKAYPKTRLIILGDGPDLRSLKSQAVRLNLDPKIFKGFVPNVEYYLAISDCVVLASLWEGSPNAILETMACGIQIIATAVCGTPELLEDGKNGWLVEPHNANDLAEKMQRFLDKAKDQTKNDIQTVSPGATTGITSLTRFDPAARAKNFIELYKSLD